MATFSRLFLCFDGIDYFARVWLNGELLGVHEGMFGGPSIEVSHRLKSAQPNEILVEVRAGDWGNKKGYSSRSPVGVIRPWVLGRGLGAEMFFPLGMWRGVRLEVAPATHMERPFLVTPEAGEDAARLELSVEILSGTHSLAAAEGAAGSTAMAARLDLLDCQSGTACFSQEFPIKTSAGRETVKQEFTVRQPRLWWPNGMGDPYLYRARLTLLRDGIASDVIEFDYGIRTLVTVPTAQMQPKDARGNWQFVINGRRLFMKGVNWMPADILLDLPRDRYQWLLERVKAGGFQILRVWGGGILENDDFYAVCNELGLLVWQDFPIGNTDVTNWPQDVWEAQVSQNICCLRNHPALAVYCGGNEFEYAAPGNKATMTTWERCLTQLDPTRPYRMASPAHGSLHTYPDMDPTWYGRLHSKVPYVSETGMHNIPDAANMREVVDVAELDKPIKDMLHDSFATTYPDLRHHFVEFQASRVPRMLSRASHVDDMSAPTIDSLAEATQIGAGEFYQVLSEELQSQYPTTAGLMVWVYKRPWPVIAIMLVDGFGHPTAPYYFMKRTYEPTHVMVNLSRLFWAAGEKIPLRVQVLHAPQAEKADLKASVAVYDAAFCRQWRQEQTVTLPSGPSVTAAGEWEFTIPQAFEESFFFVLAELRDAGGGLLSRSVYWPRCLKRMADPAFANEYRSKPQPWPTLEKGPWLKPQAASLQTTLEAQVLKHEPIDATRSRVLVLVRNTGPRPAFTTRVDITGTKRSCFATDNYFWLAPGEDRQLAMDVLWRDPATRTWLLARLARPIAAGPRAPQDLPVDAGRVDRARRRPQRPVHDAVPPHQRPKDREIAMTAPVVMAYPSAGAAPPVQRRTMTRSPRSLDVVSWLPAGETQNMAVTRKVSLSSPLRGFTTRSELVLSRTAKSVIGPGCCSKLLIVPPCSGALSTRPSGTPLAAEGGAGVRGRIT